MCTDGRVLLLIPRGLRPRFTVPLAYLLSVTTPSSPLATTLAGLSLRNPVLLAAGCAGTLHEFGDVLDLSRVGGLVTKSITPKPREGNPFRRIMPTGHHGLFTPNRSRGMMNAIGLANPGLEAFEEHYLPRAKGVAAATTLIGSVAGFSIEDYQAVAATFDEWADDGLAAIELNVSCPNVRTGLEYGATPALIRELMTNVMQVVKRVPVFVKLSPVTHEIVDVARAAAEAGARGLTIANTIPAMAIDVETRRPMLANTTGGLSGPAVHAVAVRLVHQVYRAFAKDAGVPIIGVGGVYSWQDAAEFILAGATAVQMGTALYADPRSPLGVVKGLEKWVARQGRANIGDLVGAVHLI